MHHGAVDRFERPDGWTSIRCGAGQAFSDASAIRGSSQLQCLCGFQRFRPLHDDDPASAMRSHDRGVVYKLHLHTKHQNGQRRRSAWTGRNGRNRRRKIFFAAGPNRCNLRELCADLRKNSRHREARAKVRLSAGRARETSRIDPDRPRFSFRLRTPATRFRIRDIPRRARNRRRCFRSRVARRRRAPGAAG